ncbi:hypothetical protein [Streptomyces sp. NPDC056723]|uniref:hypothetical protein n=1 Tax=Streptomyces sp. NPDC056723 TaxID=3345925 RepID=UPI00368DE8EA
MSAHEFSRAAAERRLGPAAVEAIRRQTAAAPPLRPEQREQLRAVFVSARVMAVELDRPAQAAA